MDTLAEFMSAYGLRGQHGPDRAMTRYRHDLNKMVENNEISTGPGRYALGVPNAYGNAVYAPNPTVRMQKWGASHDMSSTKTDVESDLRNLGRPVTRAACGSHYDPARDQRRLTSMPEADFPQTHARLIDPPCTLRGSGVNRFEWLCQNPQEGVMMPFEWAVDTRHSAKDAYMTKILKPLDTSIAAREHTAVCGRIYMDPAVPVARIPGPKDAPNFTDSLGNTHTPVGPVHFTPRGPPPVGRVYENAVPPIMKDNAEAVRARTGILAPPPPFIAL